MTIPMCETEEYATTYFRSVCAIAESAPYTMFTHAPVPMSHAWPCNEHGERPGSTDRAKIPPRRDCDRQRRWRVGNMPTYSCVGAAVSRYAHARIPRGGIWPEEQEAPISRYVGRTASA